ncbi:hypothetical protein CCM_05606 [Cordyceps militaris CM01]|uniref:Rhodopsin domain-containing protein n=1 Tax=Cordyceps militaris (strain CM01) TaxID=983644 RepID=G3JKK9_CORMM|nr:uncharacterized protein CCM_05606 [Cordyceps militaris CM01]EGX91448.1 hypothetical protein CCM_05606 [Cordyceps militaris CM01]
MAEVDLDEYNGGRLVGATIALLALSWITIGLRTYTRAVIMRSFQSDDWLMLVAQIIFTALCACIFEGVRRGMGRHNAAIKTDDDRVAALMWQAIATIAYILSMMFVKLSIGVFLLRLSARKVYSIIIKISLIVVTLYTLGVFFWDVFQCMPVAKQWDYRIMEGHCASGQDIINAAYAISVLTVVSDWFYALLPIPMLWNVKMTKQAKVTVVLILGLGIFASIATLIRVKFLAGLTETDDLLFSATDALLWSMVEPGVAIIASSLATIRPLLRVLKIRGFESTHRTPSTGLSGKSKKQSSMPGYGPNDVSLHRVTVVDSESRSEAMAYDEYHRHAAGLSSHPPPLDFNPDPVLGNKVSISAGGGNHTRVRDDSKSEMYIIEGKMVSPTWGPREYPPSDRSLEDISALEEQSQELGHGSSSGQARRR